MKRGWDTEVGQISFYMLDLAQCVLRQFRESENILLLYYVRYSFLCTYIRSLIFSHVKQENKLRF